MHSVSLVTSMILSCFQLPLTVVMKNLKKKKKKKKKASRQGDKTVWSKFACHRCRRTAYGLVRSDA